jgi:CubicO group peptidase (beta-lactamase class C family)
MSIQGFCEPRFLPLRAAFAESFAGDQADMHTELGASLSLWHRGRPVVDLWGGHVDETRTRPWSENTIVCVQSVSKGFTAACALLLWQRGALDIDAPMARYWPEFAEKGKAQLPVRWALSHQLGMPAWEEPYPGLGYDWDRATAALAASKPDLVPGREVTYHPYTYGFLVGEVVRRVSGRAPNAFLRDEITGPLGVDFRFGVASGDDGRVATFTKLRHGDNVAAASAGVAPRYADIVRRSLDVLDHEDDYNSPAWRGAVLPAANGHTNARALARFYVQLQGLLSSDTLENATALQWGGTDLILPMEANIGLGFMLNCPSFPAGPEPGTFGHAGFGGAYGFLDRRNDLAFGYTPNKLWIGTRVQTGERCKSLVDAAYRCLG